MRADEQLRQHVRFGKLSGHALARCSACGELSMVAVEPAYMSGPRKGQPRATSRSCPFCGSSLVEVPPCSALGVVPRIKPSLRRGPRRSVSAMTTEDQDPTRREEHAAEREEHAAQREQRAAEREQDAAPADPLDETQSDD